MSIPAWIYARFSSLEQSKGRSLDRQLEAGRRHIEQNGWLHSPERELIDEGRSAYAGQNRIEGSALGEFERKAELGHFSNGAVLVVEHLDRLTRQGWEEAVSILQRLTGHGVTVATIDGSAIYAAGERIEMMQVMSVILKSELAFEESNKKSKRVRDAWAKKIELIQAGSKKALTKILPAWLEADPVTRDMQLIPTRAAVVQEIYELYSAGWGLPSIVRLLNGRGEPSWGYGKKNRGMGWNSAYLHKLLTNRAVIGEFIPMSRSHRGTVEKPKGIVVHDYYPQAISNDLFNRAQNVRASRRKMGGPNEGAQNNLFSGIMSCASCGASMYFQSQQKAGRVTGHKSRVDGRPLQYVAGVNRSYMQCNNSRRHHTCDNRTRFRYEHLESSVLDAVLTLALDEKSFAMPDTVAQLQNRVADAERSIQIKQAQLNNLVENMKERASRVLANQAADLEDEIEADEAALIRLRAALAREQGQASPEEHLQRVREVRATLDSSDANERYAARVRVRQALMQVCQIRCDATGVATVMLANGLVAWRFDQQGKLLDQVDLRNRLDLHHGLTSGELAGNRAQVNAVVRRGAA